MLRYVFGRTRFTKTAIKNDRRTVRPRFDVLEERTTPAIIQVTSSADTGAGTLRQAITDANANVGSDIIVFNFASPTTITLASVLPTVNSPMTIDGSSASVTVNANGLGGNVLNLTANADNVLLRNFKLLGASGTAVNVQTGADNVTIDGLNIADTAAAYNGDSGIVASGANNLTIKNLTAYNKQYPIQVTGGSSVTVTNNDLSTAQRSLYLDNVAVGTGGFAVKVSGNIYSGATDRIVELRNMPNLIVSDGSVVGTSVTLEASRGIATSAAATAAIWLNNTDNVTIKNVDLSYGLGTTGGRALYVEGNTTGLIVDGVNFTGRGNGSYVIDSPTSSNQDFQILNSTFANSQSVFSFSGITQNSLTNGPVLISGNTFSNIGSTPFYFSNVANLQIADPLNANANTDVVLTAGSFLNSQTENGVFNLNNVDNVTFNGVDFSATNTGGGYGIFLQGGCDTVSIQNVNFTNRGRSDHAALYTNGVTNLSVTGSNFTGTASAVILQNVTGSALANGAPFYFGPTNVFGGNSNYVFNITNISGLQVSDVAHADATTDIVIPDGNMTNAATESGVFNLNNVDNVTFNDVDFSAAASGGGYGIIENGSDVISIQNCNFTNRGRSDHAALYVDNGSNLSVTGSNFTGTVWAVRLNSITGTGAGGGGPIYFGGTNVWGNHSNYVFQLYNMTDLKVTDVARADATADIVLPDGSFLNAAAENGIFNLNNIDNVTFDNVDFSATASGGGYGVMLQGGTDTVTIKDSNFTNRGRSDHQAIYTNGTTNLWVNGSNFTGSPSAIILQNITGAALTNGAPFYFGPTNVFGNHSNYVFNITNISGLQVSDVARADANTDIVIPDGSVLSSQTENGLFNLSNVDNVTFDNVDFSATATGGGYGIIENGSDVITIQNCNFTNRGRGDHAAIYVDNGSNMSITGSTFTGANWPLRLNAITGTGTAGGGPFYFGPTNVFGGNIATYGFQIYNMSNLQVSDVAHADANTDIVIQTGSFLNSQIENGAFNLQSVSNVTFNYVDLSAATANLTGYGILLNGSNNVSIQNVNFTNRGRSDRAAIYVDNGTNLTVDGSTFTGAAIAARLNGITGTGGAGGAPIYFGPGNVFGNNSYRVFEMYNFTAAAGLQITDVTNATSASDIIVPDGSFMTSAADQGVFQFQNVDNVTFTSFDFGATASGGGYGIYLFGSNDNVTVIDSNFSNRGRSDRAAVLASGGTNLTITGSNFIGAVNGPYADGVTGTGGAGGGPIYFANNNLVTSRRGYELRNIPNLLMVAVATAGADVIAPTGTLSGPASEGVFYFRNVDGTTINGLDFTYNGSSRSGRGIYSEGDCDNLIIQNVTSANRDDGIRLDGGSTSIVNSLLANNNDGLELNGVSIAAGTGTDHVTGSWLYANTIGIRTNSSVVAKNNFWSVASAPVTAITPTSGGSDGYSGTVTFTPVLTDVPDGLPMPFAVNTTTDVNDAPDLSSITALTLHRGADNRISLREAIIAANNTPGANVVSFGLGGGGQAITLTSALPTITDPITIDGSTQSGFLSGVTINGFASSAALGATNPEGMTLDNDGNAYIACNDAANVVKKITPAGIVTTFVNAVPNLVGPRAIVFNPADNKLYLVDEGGHLFQITLAGVATQIATGLGSTRAIAVGPDGNLYVSGSFTRIWKVTTAGTVSTYVTGSQFLGSAGLAFNGAGDLFVSTPNGGNSITKVAVGGAISTYATGFNNPAGVAVDPSGNVYVANGSSQNILMVAPSGAVTTIIGNSSGNLNDPYGLVRDVAGGLFVGSRSQNRVSKISMPLVNLVNIDASAIPTGTPLSLGAGANGSTVSWITITGVTSGTALSVTGVTGASLSHLTLSAPTPAQGTGIAINGGGSISIEAPTINGRATAISVQNAASVTLVAGTITNGTVGVAVGGTATGVNLAQNIFSGNTTAGVSNTSATQVVASYDYWGASTGPNTAGADATSGDVLVVPFLSFPPASLATSPLIVNTELDVVDGSDNLTSFREAIITANSNPSAHTIAFAIGTGNKTIVMSTALGVFPQITGQLTIDGTTQPGGTITIDANYLSGDVFNLSGSADNSIFKGFTISNAPGQPIRLASGTDRVTIQNLNVSWSGSSRSGYGVIADGNTTTNLTIDGLVASNRTTAIQVNNGANQNIKIVNSTLTNNGIGAYLENITGTALAGGGPIELSGNNFANSATALQFNSLTNIQVAGAFAAGVDIVLDAASGLGSVTGTVITMISNTTVSINGVNLSWTGTGTSGGHGIESNNNNGMTLTNVTVANRNFGFYAHNNTRNLIVTGSTFTANNLPFYLSNIQPVSGGAGEGGPMLIRGNTYSGNRNRIEIHGTQNFQIAATAMPGDGVDIELPSSMFGTMSGGLYLVSNSNVTITGLDLTWTGSGRSSSHGIESNSNVNLTISGVTAANRNFGFYAFNNTQNLVITGSTMTNNSYAFYLDNVQKNGAGAGEDGPMLIRNNTFSNNANGVQVNNTSNFTIAGSGTAGDGNDVIVPANVFSGLSGTAITLISNTNVGVRNVDLSWSGVGIAGGHGIESNNNNGVTINNVTFAKRNFGVYAHNNTRNLVITGSTFTGNSIPFYFNNVQSTGGAGAGEGAPVLIRGNTFTNNVQGIQMYGVGGPLQIADAGSAGDGVDIVLPDGMFSTVNNTPLTMGDMSNVTITGIDMSWGGAGRAANYGIDAYRINGLTIDGVSVANRANGMRFYNQGTFTNVTVVNSNLNNTNQALSFDNITGTGTAGGGPIRIANNTYAGSTNGLYFNNINQPLQFATVDGTGIDVVISAASGLAGTLTSGSAIQLNNFSTAGSSIDGLDLSYYGQSRSGTGLYTNNVAGLTVTNVRAGGRTYGMQLNGGTTFVSGAVLTSNDNGFWSTTGLLSPNSDHITQSFLGGNTNAVVGTVTAKNNFWGAFNGPSNSPNNGNGNPYSGTVTFNPVLVAPPSGLSAWDFGDAPDTFTTTLGANPIPTIGGARHYPFGPRLGAARDIEFNGQPSAAASDDDTTGSPADEDGVTLASTYMVGQGAAAVTINAQNFQSLARVDGWIDFNHDGDFSDVSEKILDGVAVPVVGLNTLTFRIPTTALAGLAFARFRISTNGGLGPVGEASNGEVEDYQVTLVGGTDFGDAPATYGTATASHVLGGPYFGIATDTEFAPHVPLDGSGDDTNNDDEDGVYFNSELVGGLPSFTAGLDTTINLYASAPGFVDAWVDFNADGDFDDVGEQVVTSLAVVAGDNSIVVSSAISIVSGNSFARFRISTAGNLTATGAAADGEVEDYAVRLVNSNSYWLPTAAGTYSWNNPANWSNGFVPNVIDQNAYFNSDIDGPQIVTVDQNVTVGSLVIGDANGTTPITINPNGGVITLDVSSGSAVISKSVGGTDVIAVNIALNDPLAVTNNGSSDLRLSGVLSSAAGIGVTKLGAGQVTLSGANTYQGVTAVQAGVLVAASNGALGLGTAGTTVADGSSLALSSGAAITSGEALSLNGAGAPDQPGALFNLSGANSYVGAISGTNIGIGSASGTLTLGGTINPGSNDVTFTGAGNVIVNSSIVAGVNTGVVETFFDVQGTPTQTQSDIEYYRSRTLTSGDAQGQLAGQINYLDRTAFANRAAALGAAGFDSAAFAVMWITRFTPNETGAWGFRFDNVDDNASMWIDTDGNGTFELANRFESRGCCGGSGDTFTPILTAGQTYLMGFLFSDDGSTGANMTNMSFRSPTAAGYGAGSWVGLTPSSYPNAFVALTPAINNVYKSGSGTLTLAGTNTYSGTLIVTAGTVLSTGSLPAGSPVSVSSTVVGSIATLGGTNSINGQVVLAGARSRITGGDLGVIGTLTLASGLTFGGGSMAEFDVASTTSHDFINVTAGSLIVNAGTIVRVPDGLSPGTYPLIGFVGAAPSIANFTLQTTAGGAVPPYYTLAIAGSKVNLVVQTSTPVVTSVAPFIGPTAGGNTVVIMGTGFISVLHVRFGGVPAMSYVVNSPTQITAVAPARAASTVNVTVENTNAISDTSTTNDDYTFALPTITSVTVNGGDIDARDGFGNRLAIGDRQSIVTQILVTFSQPVTLDTDAFTIDNLAASVTATGVQPSTENVTLVASGVEGTGDSMTGYTEYLLKFAEGEGSVLVDNINSGGSGNIFTMLKDGLYQLNAVGSRIHAGSDTATDRSDVFWALYGVVNPGDVKITGAVGGGDDTLSIDGIALSDMYRTFNSRSDTPDGPPPYDVNFDQTADGFVDGIDLSRFYAYFGTIWQF